MGDVTIWNPGCEECGAQFLSGEGAPLDALGADGDFYLDTLTTELYGPKASDVWPTPPVSLVGPTGATGAIGATGPQGEQGIPGPKGVKGDTGLTGAVGPAGPAGADGVDGSGTTIYGSSIDPVGTDGVTGDFWLNTATGFLWGPKDEFTFWVGTGFSLIGPTGATGATGPAGADGVPVESHYGTQAVTVNTTPIAFIAAADPTLSTNSDYIQITGIFDALPSGELNGVTQQTNQLTVNRSGVYKIAMWATVSSDTNNSKLGFKFAVNSVISLGRRPGSNLDTAGSLHTVSAYGLHLFAQGDILTLVAACDKTAGITIHDLVFSVNELNASEVNLLLAVQEEGAAVVSASTMNFVGAGVTATDVGGVATITIPGSAASALTTQDEGVSLSTATTLLNFVGAGVTATEPVADQITITIPGGGASTLDIQDEGVSLTTSPTLINFVGAGITATEPVADQITVTVPGGISGVAVQEEGAAVVTASTVNFVGTGVTATDVGGVATVTVPGNPSIQEEGVTITTSPALINFVGAGATVTDVAGVATVTIPGGGGGGSGGWMAGLASGAVLFIPELTGSYAGVKPLGNTQIHLVPFIVDSEIIVEAMQIDVTTAIAASQVDLAIYNAINNGQPGTLVDSVQVASGTTGVKTGTFASPVTLPPGLYFRAMASTTNGIVIRGLGEVGSRMLTQLNLFTITDPWVAMANTTEFSEANVAFGSLPGGGYTYGMDLTGLSITRAIISADTVGSVAALVIA